MEEQWLLSCCSLAAKVGEVDCLGQIGFLSSIKGPLGAEVIGGIKHCLGFGRGKKFSQESSHGGVGPKWVLPMG